jgi:signal transduction histidine kinase
MLSGLLVIEARAEFFDVIEQFNRGLLAFSTLNVILVLSVAFLLIRSIKKGFQLQTQINNQEHLVKLGEMAASVAHELRNPLGIIKGTHSLIEKKYGTQEDEFFTFIPAELDRLNGLIEEFLLFARNKPLDIQPVDLEKLLEKIKLGFSDKKQLKIEVNLGKNIPSLKTDSSLLEQILLNIIKNSAQAVNYKGNILLTVRHSDKKLNIQIIDNGLGIKSDIMDRIFEPFFSTKEEGSGLGLSITKKLVEQLQGEILIHSQSNQGTTVTILLPLR